jgi:hypothetical protein
MNKLPEPDDVDFVVGGVEPEPGTSIATSNAIDEYKRRPEYQAEAEEAKRILAQLRVPHRSCATAQTSDTSTEPSFRRSLIEEGQVKEARKLVLRQGERRLGPADETTRTALESIAELDVLERLFDRTPAVSNWAELLAER